MDWGWMSVIETETIEGHSHVKHILGHVFPQEWRISWAVSVAQFHRVTPDHDRAAEIVPTTHSEILKRVPIHDPSIMRNFAIILIIQLSEVPLN